MSTGAVTMLQPGDLVWDYSFERPTDTQLRNAGVKGVSRYLSLINTATTPKVLTYDEAHHLADLGVAVMLNYEWTPDGPLKGAARGVSDATWTNRFRHESGVWGRPLDWPDDVPVVVSLDTGATTAQLEGPVLEYYEAFKVTYTGSVIGSYQGIFLHRTLQAHGVSDGPFWTAGGAWSWSGSPAAVDDPPTQIVQRVSGVGGHNDLLAPVAFWNPNGDSDPLEDDVLTDDDKAWIAQTVHDVCDPQFNTLWRAWTDDLWGNGVPAYNGLQGVWDMVRPDKHQLVDSIVAALPTGGTGGLTHDDVVAAVKEALDSTLWATLRQT